MCIRDRCFDNGISEQEYATDQGNVEIKKTSVEEMMIHQADDGKSRVPDFTGKTMGEVVRIARERNIEVRLTGSGWAVKQKPAPGTYGADQTVCAVLFRPAE